MIRRPSLLLRCLTLLAVLAGLLGPAVSLAFAPVDPLVGVCRAPDAAGPPLDASHGWFDHCSACGALGQNLGSPGRFIAPQPSATATPALLPQASIRVAGSQASPPPARAPPSAS